MIVVYKTYVQLWDLNECRDLGGVAVPERYFLSYVLPYKYNERNICNCTRFLSNPLFSSLQLLTPLHGPILNVYSVSCYEFPTFSQFLYVGTGMGNVKVIHTSKMYISPYTVVCDGFSRCSVLSIRANPREDNLLLIAYSNNVIVEWSLMHKKPQKKYILDQFGMAVRTFLGLVSISSLSRTHLLSPSSLLFSSLSRLEPMGTCR